jgi:hypothetical protein
MMKTAAAWVTLLGLFAQDDGQAPLSLHPDNPHYFLWRGKPTILITSGEHYGAVLNLDFDYETYLRTLQSDGLNHTRTWAGTYREVPGSFGITDNTLAPLPGRYIAPWARSAEPGYAHGGAKFDLTKWDEAFFKRLKHFMAVASECGVVVELNLWCPNYDEGLWKASPMHVSNNVNGVGKCGREEVYTLKHPDLLEVQVATTRKIVQELKDFDNLYYEIANEPYFAGVTLEWQHRIAEVIAETEKDFPRRHLISQNVANGRAKVKNPHPAISIFNFHYCHPPDVVAMNYGLNKPIGENETGFRGKEDVLYRTEGWDFILAGGALYNNLDYSFTYKNAKGTFLEYASPGGGSPALRKQLRVLKDFIHGFDFLRMAPSTALKASTPGLSVRALAEPGKQYAAYVMEPPGAQDFSVRWTGLIEAPASETFTFTATADDGVRLWVNDRKLVDTWTDPPAKEAGGTVALEAGKKVPIVLEYYQGTGGAVAKLAWSSPSLKKQIVPKNRFTLPDGSGPGLRGEYFEGRDLQVSKLVRTDAQVNFDWSGKIPFPRKPKERRTDVTLDLPAGSWRAEWVNPKTGDVDKLAEFSHPGGPKALSSPAFTEDVALRLRPMK